MITVSVPAKVHLLGEHAVVYGKPALLAAINKKVFIKIRYSKEKQILGVRGYEKNVLQLLAILEKEIKKQTKIKSIKPCTLLIRSEISVGSGLGSSAALSAGLTAALLSLHKIKSNKKMIFDIAFAGEKFFHGNPSGGDLATAIEGGFLWFIKESDSSKIFSHLPFTHHKNIKQFILINSGKPVESTKEMVQKVAKFKSSSPRKVESLFNSQEKLTKQMAIALKDGDENSLIRCIKLGEKNLEELGVVGEKAKSIIRGVEELGGAAKISGAGGIKNGSGMILVYARDRSNLMDYARQEKLETLSIKVGEEGLRQEKYE